MENAGCVLTMGKLSTLSPNGRACQLCFSIEETSAEVSNVKPMHECESTFSLSQANLHIPLICQDHQSQGDGGIEMRHLNQRGRCEMIV